MSMYLHPVTPIRCVCARIVKTSFEMEMGSEKPEASASEYTLSLENE